MQLARRPWLFALVLALALLYMDPLRLGPVAGGGRPRFRPVRHDVASYREVMKKWEMMMMNGSRRRVVELGRREFSGEVFGPESLEFDAAGRGPYAGLADGRIVRWMGEGAGWQTFALVSPNWSEEECSNGPESTTRKQHAKEKVCGRPLGLRFHRSSGQLYVADAYHGLLVVDGAGAARTLATHAGGNPILFANDLDVHPNGSIFFTDSSARYDRKDHFFILLEGESTGRLLRYDPPSKTTVVVLTGLAFPNGVQISGDQSFLLFTETTNCRVMKLWLAGEKEGEVELFANLPGFPDNVRSNSDGRYWVAVDCCRTKVQELLSRNPWLRSLYFRLPASLSFLARMTAVEMFTVVVLLDGDGAAVEILQDPSGDVMRLVSEVREVAGKLWIGTVAHNHIATLPYNSTHVIT